MSSVTSSMQQEARVISVLQLLETFEQVLHHS